MPHRRPLVAVRRAAADFWRMLSRVAAGDHADIAVTPAEGRALDAAGVLDPVARRFAVWRRSVLWVAAAGTAFASAVGVGGGLFARAEFLTPLGVALFGFVLPLATFAIPIGAVWAAIRYTQPAHSSRFLVAAGGVSIGLPLAVMFVPVEYVAEVDISPETTPEVRDAAWTAIRTVVGVMFYAALVPTVLSLLAAVTRASVQVKLFIPESVVPGWGLVTSVPLSVLLTLAAFVLLYHAAGNALLLAGVVLAVGAPLLYLTRFGDLTRPVSAEVAAGLVRTGRVVTGVALAGVGLVGAYLLTATVLGKPLVAFDGSGWLRPWSGDVVAKVAEYAGRSLFLTVLFADLLVRMTLSVWLEERTFARGPRAADYDRMMSGLAGVAACDHLAADVRRQAPEPAAEILPVRNGRPA